MIHRPISRLASALALCTVFAAASLAAQSPPPGPRPGPGPDRGPGPPPGPTAVSTADWKTIAVANSPPSPSVASAQHGDPLHFTPFGFARTLQNRYTPSLATAENFSPRGRFLLSTHDGAFLSIGPKGSVEATKAFGTYQDTLVKVVEAVPEGAGFRLDSELHALYSLDAKSDRLVFKNNWGVASAGDSPGAVVFSYDAETHRLRALSRSAYNTATFGHSSDASFAKGKFVRFEGGQFVLVATEAEATPLTLSLSPIDVTMPRDFNPDAVPYQPNARVSVKDWVRNSRNDVESSQGKFLKDLDPQYRPQVAEVGNSTATRAAATAALDQIQKTLEAEGAKLRYSKALYLAFREGALNTLLASDGIANGWLGMNTVPFVYFTNAVDAQGRHHPFLVVLSYSISDKPNRLVDVARPPGDGEAGGYAEQTVTRDATLQLYMTKIPLRDYGLVKAFADNALPRSLKSEARASGPDDAYTYASTSAVGIAVDGVVVYPVLNNTLATAHEVAEITSTGIHVGRGMGLHYHGDGHTAANHDLTLYNLTDYAGQKHPPLLGFGLDGVALFGAYEASHPNMQGFAGGLDEFGGHGDPVLGYHYHAHLVSAKTAQGTPYTLHVLMKGAWKGKITDVPEFWDKPRGEPAYAMSQRHAYVGWKAPQ